MHQFRQSASGGNYPLNGKGQQHSVWHDEDGFDGTFASSHNSNNNGSFPASFEAHPFYEKQTDDQSTALPMPLDSNTADACGGGEQQETGGGGEAAYLPLPSGSAGGMPDDGQLQQHQRVASRGANIKTNDAASQQQRRAEAVLSKAEERKVLQEGFAMAAVKAIDDVSYELGGRGGGGGASSSLGATNGVDFYNGRGGEKGSEAFDYHFDEELKPFKIVTSRNAKAADQYNKDPRNFSAGAAEEHGIAGGGAGEHNTARRGLDVFRRLWGSGASPPASSPSRNGGSGGGGGPLSTHHNSSENSHAIRKDRSPSHTQSDLYNAVADDAMFKYNTLDHQHRSHGGLGAVMALDDGRRWKAMRARIEGVLGDQVDGTSSSSASFASNRTSTATSPAMNATRGGGGGGGGASSQLSPSILSSLATNNTNGAASINAAPTQQQNTSRGAAKATSNISPRLGATTNPLRTDHGLLLVCPIVPLPSPAKNRRSQQQHYEVPTGAAPPSLAEGKGREGGGGSSFLEIFASTMGGAFGGGGSSFASSARTSPSLGAAATAPPPPLGGML